MVANDNTKIFIMFDPTPPDLFDDVCQYVNGLF